MTIEELKKMPFRFVGHLNMEHEHYTTYATEDGRLGFCDHVKYRNGRPTKRTYRHWQIDGNVYKTKEKFLEALRDFNPSVVSIRSRPYQNTVARMKHERDARPAATTDEEQQPIDVPLDMVTTPDQSWQLLTSGMPRETADRKAVPCSSPSYFGMSKEAFSVIMADPHDFDPITLRPFGTAFVAWTLGRLIDMLPERLNMQLEYPAERYIYRHGDEYVVGYKSHVQQVEQRKPSLAEALVEMMRYLLQHDITKRQLNLIKQD